MALRDVKTGRIVVIRLCVAALDEGRVVPAVYHDAGRSSCPDHDDRAGSCLETFHAESRMAAWPWRKAWRAWRRWRERATYPLMSISSPRGPGGEPR